MEQKSKGMHLWGWILAVLLVIAVLGGGTFLFIQGKLNRINRVEEGKVETVDPLNEDFEIDQELAEEIQNQGLEDVLDPEDVDFGNVDIDVIRDKDVVNLLLIGQDRREGQGRQRSDSMILCSINKKKDKIILSSIMRDLYVPIPGYSHNRINAAYQFGGMELLDRVIEESLGIHVDGNVEVDFDGFVQSMAKLGNLDIELNQAEADYMNRNGDGVEQPDMAGNPWKLKAGVNSLTPEQILAYSRIRYVGNSDWERTDRQRRVLTAAFEKARKKGLLGMLSLADQVFPNLTTDMSNGEIMGIVYEVMINGITEVESYRIPVEGTYTNETLRMGMEVLVPELGKNSQYLKGYIYGEGE